MSDIQINVARYIEDKALGICQIIKLNGQPFYSAKEFDRTGKTIIVNAPIAEESLKDAIANVERELAEKLKTKAAIEQMIADIAFAQELLKVT